MFIQNGEWLFYEQLWLAIRDSWEYYVEKKSRATFKVSRQDCHHQSDTFHGREWESVGKWQLLTWKWWEHLGERIITSQLLHEKSNYKLGLRKEEFRYQRLKRGRDTLGNGNLEDQDVDVSNPEIANRWGRSKVCTDRWVGDKFGETIKWLQEEPNHYLIKYQSGWAWYLICTIYIRPQFLWASVILCLI